MRVSVVRSPSLIRSSRFSRVTRPREVGDLRRPFARLSLFGDLPGDAVFGDGEERVAGAGNGGQAEHQDRTGRTSCRNLLTVLVEHRPHPPVGVAGDDRVADVQRAPVHQHRRHRAAATVEVCLDRDALSLPVDRRPQVE